MLSLTTRTRSRCTGRPSQPHARGAAGSRRPSSWPTAAYCSACGTPAGEVTTERGRSRCTFGFPAYGNGPFERMGVPTSAPLLSAFLLVCVTELAAAWLLWRLRPAGVRLATVLLPFEFAFWIGFALPFARADALAHCAPRSGDLWHSPHTETRSTSSTGRRRTSFHTPIATPADRRRRPSCAALMTSMQNNTPGSPAQPA